MVEIRIILNKRAVRPDIIKLTEEKIYVQMEPTSISCRRKAMNIASLTVKNHICLVSKQEDCMDLKSKNSEIVLNKLIKINFHYPN